MSIYLALSPQVQAAGAPQSARSPRNRRVNDIIATPSPCTRWVRGGAGRGSVEAPRPDFIQNASCARQSPARRRHLQRFPREKSMEINRAHTGFPLPLPQTRPGPARSMACVRSMHGPDYNYPPWNPSRDPFDNSQVNEMIYRRHFHFYIQESSSLEWSPITCPQPGKAEQGKGRDPRRERRGSRCTHGRVNGLTANSAS